MPSVAASALMWLRTREDQLLDRLGRLVAVPSHVTQPEGLGTMAQLVAEELAISGFTRIPSPSNSMSDVPEWAQRLLSPDVPRERLLPPTVLHRPGSSARVLVLADLDAAMVSPADVCRMAVRDGRAFGPAIADMKGGIAVLIAGVEAARHLDQPLPAITVVLSADEQAGSVRSGPAISALANDADWVICMECARDGGRLMHSRAHIGVGSLVALGMESHAGTARDVGVNAIWRLARALTALEDPGVSRPEAFVTPTMLTGGRRRSVVPGQATAVLDVRARDAESWAGLEQRLRQAIEDPEQEQTTMLELYSHRHGVPRTAHTDRLLDIVRGVASGIGLEIGSSASMAAGSSAFVDAWRVPVLDGLGPAGGSLMTPDEYIEVESLAERAAVLAGTFAALA